jgi:hypothetical protein
MAGLKESYCTADRMRLVTPPNSNGWTIPLSKTSFLYMSVNNNLEALSTKYGKFPIWQFFHLLPVSLTPATNNLYFQIFSQIFIKIRNGPHGTLKGPGDTDS